MFMKKVLIIALFMSFGLVGLATATSTIQSQNAAFAGEKGAGYAVDASGVPKDPRVIVTQIINILLSLLGILTTVYMVYGGYLVLTSAGIPERIEQGKKVIMNCIIGLVIIFLAYGITWLVFNILSGGELYNGQPGGFDWFENNDPAAPNDPFMN
jgi:tellurite resistance protein TehA-like permease